MDTVCKPHSENHKLAKIDAKLFNTCHYFSLLNGALTGKITECDMKLFEQLFAMDSS
jgi:hypothetical protein